MRISTFYQNAFYALMGVIVGFIIGYSMFYTQPKTEIRLNTQPIEKVQTFPSDSLVVELNDANLMKELIKNDIKHPEIVLAQAKLETGYYKSQVCKTHHNLFGLRGKDGYYKFPNWQASVKAYKDYVQYRYDGQSDYFAWLDKIGYAEDEAYIRLVKHVMECNKS